MFSKIKILTTVCLSLLAFVSISDAQVCSPVPNGLISWWPADGNALDPRSRNNGTLRNGASFSVGQVGQAFSLDGLDDFIEVPDMPSLDVQQFTIEAWVFPTSDISGGSPDSTSFIVAKESASSNQYILGRKNNTACGSGGGIPTGNLAFHIEGLSGLPNDCSDYVNGNAYLPLNTWSHVALTYDGANVRTFLNGVLTRTISATGTIPDTTGSLQIGGRIRGGTSFWAGQIDEPAIYNRGLSPSEIQAIFDAGTAGKCKPTATVAPACLTGWWPGDGNANDISGNNNHGTLQDNAGFAVGKVEQSFNLDGVNDSVRIPHNANLNIQGSFSAEAWIFPRTLPNAGPRIFDKDSDSDLDNRWLLALNNDGTNVNSLTVAINSSAVVTPNNSISLNQWSHVAFTYNSATGDLKLFINGVQAATANIGTQTTSNTAPLVIGDDFGTSTRDFDGLIDEASIYNCALTQDEITSIFNAGSAGKLKPFAPTAAGVDVGGRVMTSDARGISKARLTLTDSNGLTRTALSNPFGYYRFTDVPVGATYVISVERKGYEFEPRSITLQDELTDLDFIAVSALPKSPKGAWDKRLFTVSGLFSALWH